MTELEALTARLDDFEGTIAHQERTIEELNTVVTHQWKEIDLLNLRFASLESRLKENEDRLALLAPNEPPPPPHY